MRAELGDHGRRLWSFRGIVGPPAPSCSVRRCWQRRRRKPVPGHKRNDLAAPAAHPDGHRDSGCWWSGTMRLVSDQTTAAQPRDPAPLAESWRLAHGDVQRTDTWFRCGDTHRLLVVVSHARACDGCSRRSCGRRGRDLRVPANSVGRSNIQDMDTRSSWSFASTTAQAGRDCWRRVHCLVRSAAASLSSFLAIVVSTLGWEQ